MTFTIGTTHGIDFSVYLQPQPTYYAETTASTLWDTTNSESEAAYLRWGALPQTIIPERPAAVRFEPITYKVKEGDNPSIIGTYFGLQPSTIVWANTEVKENPDLLRIGQTLVIPPVDGVLHTVSESDTVAGLAGKYKVDVAVITTYPGNKLGGDAEKPLIIGQQVMVPGGVMPYDPPQPVVVVTPAPAPAPRAAAPTTRPATTSPATTRSSSTSTGYVGSTGCCRWPVTGRITQNPSRYHMALDIATSMGTPVVASDGGRVVVAGWDNTGYGWTVVIDHGNGLRTRYAHFSSYVVNVGNYVNKGQLIGRIGSTGRSTGPHLHFEVLRNGSRQNPWNWLP
ncbi:MAG: peptidoglycan DD-metalloendopeptidase family protein [Ardenticatenales bacterium]|nr:peptidoglycan DD-metalloendopeptidase family protein [Ardenticatenales bacterium]